MSYIVRSGSRQYIVEKGQKILVNYLKDSEVGDVIQLDVLAVFGEDSDIDTIQASVVSHQKGKKIRVVKYKSKSNYHRQYGPRQTETILEISGGDKKKVAKKVTKKVVEKK